MDATRTKTIKELEEELEELRHQLFEANETIEAIRTGQVDALVVENENGHQLYTLKTADITYRVFIENMTEGAVTVNQEGIILYCNSQFASMVQKPLPGITGLSFHQFIAAGSRGVYNKLFKDCWEQDCKGEVHLKGSPFDKPVQLSLATLELEEGTSLSIILTDLTAQKETQQQLEAKNLQLATMNEALETSNHDLQQFASVASHDLQEPLRKIQMFSNLLKEKCGDRFTPESKRYVEKIADSASRMKALVIDILNYSKLSARDNLVEPTDLNQLVSGLLEDFELIIQEKEARINMTGLPAIEVNRGQIRQVFQNIISNALKFSKEGQCPVIDIKATRLSEKNFESREQKDGPYCLISITDNGIGFDEKYLDTIFTLFERLHSKDSFEGTGIGLAITKKIIEKHNGLVSAKSHLGKGAEFMILLPVTQEKQV